MKKPDFVLDIFLQPGDFHFGDAETSIRTVLGSCVAITAWHPQRRIGGMCHYMLPGRATRRDTLDGKYADEAIAMFLMEVERNNTRPAEYQVKLFGGGNMFPVKKHGSTDVANRNVEAARMHAALHGFKIAAHDMGQTGHRNVIFDIRSGHVWVRHVKVSSDAC